MNNKKHKLGLIVNPIAGMGGKVGLKGTDGADILEKAISLGAEKAASKKALIALKHITENLTDLEIITYPNDMGEDICNELGAQCTVLETEYKKNSSYKDTEDAAKLMLEENVDLILFAGGDGTARNIYNAVGDKVPAVGIPAGVKIHSGVYGTNPLNAGRVCVDFFKNQDIEIRELEVMDIDEELFREGKVVAKLYGYLKVPYRQEFVQSLKSGGIYSEKISLEGISDYIIESMEEDCIYLIGSGTTTKAVMERLKLPSTLLGIDIIKNKEVLKNDANEQEILEIVKDKKFKVIVSIIGGQGYIFGRGNQQLSPEVIRLMNKEDIIIISTPSKIIGLNGNPMLVDTGDEGIDKFLSGYYRVTVGYDEIYVYKCNY